MISKRDDTFCMIAIRDDAKCNSSYEDKLFLYAPKTGKLCNKSNTSVSYQIMVTRLQINWAWSSKTSFHSIYISSDKSDGRIVRIW